jgi:flagellar biosynthesis/type III secretory pathway protein FliH
VSNRDVVPFFASVLVAPTTRPLGAAIPSLPMPVTTSPWSPKPEPTSIVQPGMAEPARPVDVEAVRAEAIEAGRAEGLRETAALRAQLQNAIDALNRARAEFAAPVAELIGDAASTIIEGWLSVANRRALIAPVVQAWITSGGKGTARCHPADLEALRAEVGESGILVEADPKLARGDVAICDQVRELAHHWEPRLRELREAIASALAAA